MSKVEGQRQAGATFLQGQMACKELLSVAGTPVGQDVVETHNLLPFQIIFSCVFMGAHQLLGDGGSELRLGSLDYNFSLLKQ